jgi:hypothetical protein
VHASGCRRRRRNRDAVGSFDGLRADRDLDALRGRDDFKELLAGLRR